MEEYLKRRYEKIPPQVLVALGPQALEFFLARRESLFSGTPLVFGGVNREDVKDLPGVAGLPMEFSVVPAVEALLDMLPRTREIVLVHGSSDFDRNWRDKALLQCALFADRVKITAFPELPLDELKSRLGGLSKGTAVVYLSYFKSPTGETHTPAKVAIDIAESASVPVVGPYDTYIGSGVLGVSVSPFEEEGMVLGSLIQDVLSGAKLDDIGTLPPNPPRLILDARQVKRWGIKSVPEGAELRYRNPTLWEEHRAGVIVGLSVFCLQGGLITGLIVARSRRIRAEEELRFSEARFSGVFRGSPAAISIVRQSDGQIIDVNPMWEVTTGVPRLEAIGRTPIEAGMEVSGDGEGRFRLFLESGKALHDFEQIQRTRDGRARLLSLSTELITLHDEPCLIIVAKDVTEALEAENARQRLAQTSRLAMLGEMTASIAHEINQPLGAILSNAEAAEMLLDQPVPPMDEVRQILSDIRRDDLRASAVIQRVRALIGRREVQRVALNVNDLLVNALSMVTREASRNGITLVHELAENLPEVYADPVQIEQVILNLLINAKDAMKETPVASRRIIVRSVWRAPDAVEVEVEDRGHGIPQDKLDEVFDSFYTTKDGGMGLGLALARSIAEAHEGALIAEKNHPNGSTFRLVLPVNRLD
jgi:PAS domain S-box-containing protein